MKKFALIFGAFTLMLTSCGGEMTWDQYRETCVKTNELLRSSEEANTKCDCEIEKYKEAGITPTQVFDPAESGKVDISDC